MKKQIHNMAIGVAACVALLAMGCSNYNFAPGDELEESSSRGSYTHPQPKLSLKIEDGAGKVVYDDFSATAYLVLKEAVNYKVTLTASNKVPGIQYTLIASETSAVNPSKMEFPIVEGDSNSVRIPKFGDYALELRAEATGMEPKKVAYNAIVTCSNPSFSAGSLSSANISASGSTNVYNFNAGLNMNALDGQPNYTCAYDGTGAGIVDTTFRSCSSSGNFYSNYVGNRPISVLVKDGCGTVHTVTKTVNLPYAVPAMGAGNVFIFGQVTGSSGVMANDKRVKSVEYLATNKAGNNIVHSSFSSSNKFTIDAQMNYRMASSVNFGMKISLNGITGSIDWSNLSHNLNASNAKIERVTYSTDQAGDSATALSYSGTACTLSNQNLRVVLTAGTPCSNGSATGNKATVEVWGQYSCTRLSGSGGTIDITGSFDGLSTLVDSCSGGGGGGGGVPPIAL